MKLFVLFLSFWIVGALPAQELTDEALLDTVQRQTFRYFWDFGHPVSGLARERSDTTHINHEVVTIGGSGFAVMAIVVGVERGFITRDQGVERLLKIVHFLDEKLNAGMVSGHIG